MELVLKMATSIKNILTLLSNCKSAYEIAVDNGFVGTEQDWLASLGGVESVPPKPIDLRPIALPYPLNMSLEDIQEDVDPSAQKLDISGDDFQTCTHVLSGTDGTWYALPNSLLQPLSLGGKQIFQVVINPAQLITTPSSTPGINAVIALMNSSFDGLFSRYATGAEDSVWICNACGQVEGVDAHEGYCPSCSGDQ
jgi:hypothetical protein